jgi:hypothetical protein
MNIVHYKIYRGREPSFHGLLKRIEVQRISCLLEIKYGIVERVLPSIRAIFIAQREKGDGGC